MWWRADGWPSVEEWTALAGWVGALSAIGAAAAAIIALRIARDQLRQLIISNRELTRSNDEMARSNLSIMRPYVVVEFELRRMEARNPAHNRAGMLNLVVRNDGRTTACNITLRTSPELASSNAGGNGEKWLEYLESVKALFRGERRVDTLTPQTVLKYNLDILPEAMTADTPKRYDVSVEYEDADQNGFTSTFALDLEPWRHVIQESEPLRRISKDIQAVNETLGRVASETKSIRIQSRQRPVVRLSRPAPKLRNDGPIRWVARPSRRG